MRSHYYRSLADDAAPAPTSSIKIAPLAPVVFESTGPHHHIRVTRTQALIGIFALGVVAGIARRRS